MGRGRVRVYVWTEEWDRALREAYATAMRPHAARKAVDLMQKMTGYPRDAIYRRAAELGVGLRRRPWTTGEVRTLREHAGKLPAAKLAQLLGRSQQSVSLMSHRLKIGLLCRREGYTRQQAADLLCVSVDAIGAAYRTRELFPNRHGRLTENGLRRFFWSHLDAIDFRRMDQHWLREELRRTLAEGAPVGCPAQASGEAAP